MYEALVVGDSGDNNDDLICDVSNKKNKEYNQRNSSGDKKKKHKSVSKMKKREVILGD